MTLPVQDVQTQKRLKIKFFICKIYIETFFFALSKMKYSLDFIFPLIERNPLQKHIMQTSLTITFWKNQLNKVLKKYQKIVVFILLNCRPPIPSSNWSAIKDPRYRKTRGCLNLSFTISIENSSYPRQNKTLVSLTV